MSAPDHLHDDQFVRVYHSSYSPLPVHERDDTTYAKTIRSRHLAKSNPHGDLIFAGTEAAARSLGRPYLHKYDIPRGMVSPELWGDDMHEAGQAPAGWTLKENEQPELWETLPADASLVTPAKAIKFRNSVEDVGSTSHIFHKLSVFPGRVRYAGMDKIEDERKSIDDYWKEKWAKEAKGE